MKLHRFCSKCGKELVDFNENSEIYICSDCYNSIEMEIQLPEIILYRCNQCNGFSLQKDDQHFNWEYQPSNESEIDYLTRILYEKVFFKIEKKNNVKITLFIDQNLKFDQFNEKTIIVQIDPQNKKGLIKKDLNVRYKQMGCPNCGKIIGGRFDATIQIRIYDEHDSERLKEIMAFCAQLDNEEKQKDSKNFISKVEKTPNGFDLKVSTTMMLKIISFRLRKTYPFHIKRSGKLVGVKPENGTDLYRQTLLLKLLPVIKGDQVRIENEEYIVHKITPSTLLLMSKDDNKKISSFKFNIFEKKRYQILLR